MENSEKQMTPEESLNLIGEVISRSRNNLKTNSFFFLLWGWFIIVASLIEAFLFWHAGKTKEWGNFGLLIGMNWIGLTFIGLIIQGFYIRKHYVNKVYRTYFDKIIASMWIISAMVIVLVVYMSVSRHIAPEPYILAAISIPTAVTGVMTRFKPLIIGGILFMVFAIISVNLEQEYLKSLNSAVALICGYLIPGYMLRKKN